MKKKVKILLCALSIATAMSVLPGMAGCDVISGLIGGNSSSSEVPNDSSSAVPEELVPPTIPTSVVTFDVQGGSAVAAVTVNTGETVSAPEAPTKEGCTFIGWATDAEGSNLVAFPAKVSDDVTYYAVWEAPAAAQVTIHFTGYGELPADITVDAGSEVDLSDYVPSRDRKTFDGWLLNGEPVTSVTAENSVYLTAKWLDHVEAIYALGGDYLPEDVSDIVVPELVSVPEVDGFEGYELTLPTMEYDETKYRFDGLYIGETRIDVDGEGAPVATYNLVESVTIVARFTPIYSIGFDLNYEGAEAVETQIVSADEEAVIAIPSREDYRFMGWAEASDETNAIIVEADETSYALTANLSLKAVWEQLYTITYAYPGMEGVPAVAMEVIAGEAYELPTAAYYEGISTVSHYLLGWSTSEALGQGAVTLYSEDTEMVAGAEDVTYYAHFQERARHTVTWQYEREEGVFETLYSETIYDQSEMDEIYELPAGTLPQGLAFLYWTDAEGDQITGNNFPMVVTENLVFTAYTRDFRGQEAYRFEIESNAIVIGEGGGSGTDGFFEVVTNRPDTVISGVVAGGMGAGWNGDGGFEVMRYNVYNTADTEANVMIAIALSPGWGQSNMAIADGVAYVVEVNGVRYHFDTYTLPVLEGQNWNENWGTAWMEITLQPGENVIEYIRSRADDPETPDVNEAVNLMSGGFGNLDYLEIISPVELRASGVALHLDLNAEDAAYGEQREVMNNQNVAVNLANTPINGNVYMPANTPLLTSTPTANGNIPSRGDYADTAAAMFDLSLIPEPTRPGYQFVGWSTSATENAPIANQTRLPAEGMTLYAMWAVTYTLTYDVNADGAELPGNVEAESTVLSTDAINSAAVVPTRDGYAFTGWYTDAACENAFVSGSYLTDNTTLYAGWEAAYMVTVNYYGNNVETTPVPQGDSYILETPTRNGYEFNGWYTDADLTAPLVGTEVEGGVQITPAADMDIYASWVATFNVTFNWNNNTGGQWNDNSTNVNVPVRVEGNGVTLADVMANAAYQVPTRTGYEFAGWATRTQSGNWWSPTYTYTPVAEDAVIDAAVTLYAQWVQVGPTTFNFTFDWNEGNQDNPRTVVVSASYEAGEVEGVTFAELVELLEATEGYEEPSREGYTFGGWSTSYQPTAENPQLAEDDAVYSGDEGQYGLMVWVYWIPVEA